MAGHGPAPADTRRRANEPARGDWVDLHPLDKPVLSALPRGKWRAETRQAWEAWRKDPVTALWSPADVSFALDTIRLHNEMNASTANEVRLRMDGLGLTPKGKQDRRWRVVTRQAPAAAERARPAARTSSRKARLSIVPRQ
jgi:hypothetical protein